MPGSGNRNRIQESAPEIKFDAKITRLNPEAGVIAAADVKIGDIMTVRNVRIREDDYGLSVSMPRTKLAHMDQYKDAVFFADKGMKEKFDKAVEQAYSEYTQLMNFEEGMEEDTGGPSMNQSM